MRGIPSFFHKNINIFAVSLVNVALKQFQSFLSQHKVPDLLVVKWNSISYSDIYAGATLKNISHYIQIIVINMIFFSSIFQSIDG